MRVPRPAVVRFRVISLRCLRGESSSQSFISNRYMSAKCLQREQKEPDLLHFILLCNQFTYSKHDYNLCSIIKCITGHTFYLFVPQLFQSTMCTAGKECLVVRYRATSTHNNNKKEKNKIFPRPAYNRHLPKIRQNTTQVSVACCNLIVK